jgi:hypothetical protein
MGQVSVGCRIRPNDVGLGLSGCAMGGGPMRQHKLTAISCLGVFVVCGTAWTAPQDQQQNQPDTSAEYNADCEGWGLGCGDETTSAKWAGGKASVPG